MKREIIAIVATAVTSFGLAACGGSSGSVTTTADSTESSVSMTLEAETKQSTDTKTGESTQANENSEVKAIPIDSVLTDIVDVDPKNPLGTKLSGLYSFDAELADGSKRTAYQYVPSSIGYRQPEVMIGVPADQNAETFIEKTGWKDLSDNEGFSLLLTTADLDGWSYDDIPYLNAAFKFMNDREYLQTQDAAFYAVGYADAATPFLAFETQNAEFFAGFGAFGVDNFDTEYLSKAEKTESNATGIMKSEVSIPIWLSADSNTDSVKLLVDYWKKANNAGEDSYSNIYADQIYQPLEYFEKTNQITYADCSKVMLTIGNDKTEESGFTKYLYDQFLKRVRRQDSGDISALRPFATNAEKGMDYKTLTIGGTTREYYVYVPTDVKSGKIQNVPMVMVFHGGGGSGEEFAARSGWDKVAEERNFIAVFPTGHRSNNKFKASTTWGEEDFSFIEAMRKELIDDYSIDATRIYASGQSMGCIMGSLIAIEHPEWIAAAAVTSARQMRSEASTQNTTVTMPYMWSVGEKDEHFTEGGKDYNQIPACIAEWRERYGITATEENTYSYQNGNFHGFDFKNSQGITLVREQLVANKIHAMIPDEVYTLYDFLSCYSRTKDNTSYYMGIAIQE